MFGSLGFTELFFIFIIALLIFGPRKLPELGKTIGSALGQFKRASEDFKRTWEDEVDLEKRRPVEPKPAANSMARSAEPTIIDADPNAARASAEKLAHATLPAVEEVEPQPVERTTPSVS
ncbi:MAG: twin-arginine translocase TatA/TatE family subunit [Acidobacteria bacterium]|nr:twin-arginine translocase TatA/TatE family subunit [Acidobacteriota bacterium]